MYIVLDTTDENLLRRVYDEVNESDDRLVNDLDSEFADAYVPGTSNHIVGMAQGDPSQDADAEQRHRWLSLAAKGVRVFSDTMSADNPVYAGPLPKTDEEVRRSVVSARVAQSRAAFFTSFGVNYIGRAIIDPVTIIVLDNKKGNPSLDPALSPELEALYGSLPPEWWGTCGFVSTGNADKLQAFLENVPSAVLLAYTTGAFAKLNYAGFPFAKIGTPRTVDSTYGVAIREIANRHSYDLSL